VTELLPVHTPAWHVSVCVHLLPSLHDVLLATIVQVLVQQVVEPAIAGSQASPVSTSPSPQWLVALPLSENEP
jgi:hypothetical protein